MSVAAFTDFQLLLEMNLQKSLKITDSSLITRSIALTGWGVSTWIAVVPIYKPRNWKKRQKTSKYKSHCSPASYINRAISRLQDVLFSLGLHMHAATALKLRLPFFKNCIYIWKILCSTDHPPQASQLSSLFTEHMEYLNTTAKVWSYFHTVLNQHQYQLRFIPLVTWGPFPLQLQLIKRSLHFRNTQITPLKIKSKALYSAAAIMLYFECL